MCIETITMIACHLQWARHECRNYHFFESTLSWLSFSLVHSSIVLLILMAIYYKLMFEGSKTRLMVKRWDSGGKERRGKACESGWYPCDSWWKVLTVRHLGEVDQVIPPRCPTVKTFRQLSHGYQPLSHAFPLLSLPPLSHLFTVKRVFDPSNVSS